MGAQAKQQPTPAPLYTAKREAATDKKARRNRPAWPLPPTTPPGKTAAVAKGSHINRSRKARRRARQTVPAKTTCPESRADTGSPRCRQKAERRKRHHQKADWSRQSHDFQADSEPKQRTEPPRPNVQIEGLADYKT